MHAFRSRKRKTSLKIHSRSLLLEDLESRNLLTAVPFGASPQDTAEYLLGKIVVTPVFLESTGAIDSSSEDWTEPQIELTRQKVEEGLNWWSDLLDAQNTVHELEWVVDTTFIDQPFETSYEPISRISNDYQLWVDEFLQAQGVDTFNGLESGIREYNHAKRLEHDANWSFTIFVVNSENDSDGNFRSGGSFSRAFAFAGGQFFVSPSTRPASTFAHETGHMFWARDEYIGGGNYFQRRGYYDTQNLNAIDLNPDPNFVQAPSIMSAGTNLQLAYQNLESPASTLAMIGWQDSDGDGVFDVLDVPLSLDGVGERVSDTEYRFRGFASAEALPNRNSSGTQNDITLNRVSRVEYRIDAGAWQVIESPDSYTAELEFVINLAFGQTGQVEIRAVDAVTGITSNIFSASLVDQQESTLVTGINGFVWNDIDENGTQGSGEHGLAGIGVMLTDATGNQIELQDTAEPDDVNTGIVSETAFAGVRISNVGLDGDGTFGVAVAQDATTGDQVFVPYSFFQQQLLDSFFGQDHELRFDFDSPQSYVRIDAIGASTGSSYARLDAYDADDNLIGRANSIELANGESDTLAFGSVDNDIAYVIARAHRLTAVRFDNFAFGPESRTTADQYGRYALPYLPAGDYRIALDLPSSSFDATSPASGFRDETLLVGTQLSDIDFGVSSSASPWHNPIAPVDVDANGVVRPVDALLVIFAINSQGSGALDGRDIDFPPFIDVNNDRFLRPFDALLVINYINQNGVGGSGSGNSSEGEFGTAAMPGLGGSDRLIGESRSTEPSEAVTVNRSPAIGVRTMEWPATAPVAPESVWEEQHAFELEEDIFLSLAANLANQPWKPNNADNK